MRRIGIPLPAPEDTADNSVIVNDEELTKNEEQSADAPKKPGKRKSASKEV